MCIYYITESINTKLEDIDVKFGNMDERFTAANIKLDVVDEKLTEVDTKMDDVDKNFTDVNTKLVSLDEKFNELGEMDTEVKTQMQQVTEGEYLPDGYFTSTF